MLARISAASVAAALVAPLLLTAPVGASHDAGGPHARTTDDSCPAGRVQPAFFSDVPRDNAHRAGVECAVWWDVASGRGQSQYAPLAEVSREQMATFLRNLVLESGGTLPTPTKDHYSDDDESFHEDSINALAEAGIVSGRADGYAPKAPVERGAMATFLVNAYEYRSGQELPAPTDDAFSDDDGSTHETSTDKAAAAGFAAGVGGGSYAPRRAVQRDQMASFLTRVLDLLVEDGLAEPPAGRAGDFDAAFGDGGSTHLSFGSAYAEATDVAATADGGLVLAGFSSGDDDQDPTTHVAVARLLPDGTPDPAFGGDGLVTTQPGAYSRAEAVAVQTDGKVVVAGSVQPVAGELHSDFLLVRYNPDGSLDTSFGNGGLLTSAWRSPAYLAELVLQPDGKLLVGGSGTNDRSSTNGSDMLLERYLASGERDSSFGGDGRVEVSLAGEDQVFRPDYLDGLALQPDGRIVAAGTSAGETAEEGASVVVRLLDDGTLDPTFGDGGVARVDAGPFQRLTGVALQSDGSVVAAGSNYNDERTVRRMLVLRFDAAGELDPTFGDGGVVITQAAPQSEAADIAVDADDRLLVVGHGLDDANENGKSWLVVRYLPDGAEDESFGEGGVVRSSIGKRANAVAVQGDQILVAGCDCPFQASYRGGFESHSSFVVARLNGE